MYFNSTLLSILSFLMIVFLISCGSTEIVTIHQDQPEIEIDGSLSSWPLSETTIHNSDEFRYYVMQDDEHLYLFVDFKSPFYNRSVENAGFIIYLNPVDTDRDRRGIGFPSGAMNLLRDDPGSFENMTRDLEWLQNPQNNQRLESLAEDNFTQIMIVDRIEGVSQTQYGFVSKAQLEGQGMQFAVSEDRRYYGLEFKIPLDGSAPFELQKGQQYWLGFTIEPPDFNFREDPSARQNTGRMYGRSRYGGSDTSNRRMQMRRNLGEYSEWFQIRIE